MGLFDKNPNEAAYVGGKKHWADVIKNSGPGELLIWRQPEEDFNTNSTLVVMPGEETLFIKGGNIEQAFKEGTYQLSTENYPFISRLRNAFTGGVSTFSAVVYFVRKAHSMEILWGTSSPIQVRDPVMHIMTSVRARGSYKVQIDNGAKFLTKLLGNNISFALQDELNRYFDNEFQQHVKSSLAKAIMDSGQEILGIVAQQDELAYRIQPILQEILDDYGIRLVVFAISGIDIPEDDPNRQRLEDAFASKGVMGILGDDWGRQQSADILKDLANNPGAGGMAAMGAGIGMGAAAGGVFGGMAQQMFAPMNPQPVQQQEPVMPSSRFVQRQEAPVPARGMEASAQPNPQNSQSMLGQAPQPSAGPGVADEILKLKQLLDAGVVTDEEFAAAKQKLIENL
ncbi:MAG: SPFH domain-containing protein [Coriobacteriales bacterium]|jgi:membrane protease subunit (stomatin/prohibitin family)|nr:SPFH domain-containing protein [Coriobacteriales bacterium]